LVLFLCLFWLTGCGRHQPAPVEDFSSGMVNQDRTEKDVYRVGTGDTLYAIAFSFDLDPHDVAAWNGIASPYIIYPGQELSLVPTLNPVRDRDRTTDVQISAVKTPAGATTRPQNEQLPESSTPVAVSPPPAGDTGSGRNTQPQVKSIATTGADPITWKWPASGRVLRGFVANDPSRNGLDIAGKEGQSVTASAPGTVVYSGNGLIAYGELIIIKHSERMLSAYAHNKLRLVNEGEQVSAGQKIAEMGRNDQDEQLLHFEIRTRGKPVNPLNHLPERIR
jgi:lipoprotein NlpD